MKMFSIVCINGFIAKHIKEYSDTEQPLTYPSEKLVETVGISVTLLENMTADVAHLSSVKQCITAAIKNNVDFHWIRSIHCSLHCQVTVDGIVTGGKISFPW
jgi:hypothetical protein